MAKKTPATPAPLTFDLSVDLITKIEAQQKKLGMSSISEVVRHAISSFDFDRYEAEFEEHRQISVRLPAAMKTSLVKTAKKKKVSVGELLREAIDSLPAKAAKKAKK